MVCLLVVSYTGWFVVCWRWCARVLGLVRVVCLMTICVLVDYLIVLLLFGCCLV